MNEKGIYVVPTCGSPREQGHAERDAAALASAQLIAAGAEVNVMLHANLDAEEIRRAVKRYAGLPVRFEICETDSTPGQREEFIRRWREAGGREISGMHSFTTDEVG